MLADPAGTAVAIRVAGWDISKPKIPIWVHFGGKMLVSFMAIWFILWPCGIFYGPFGIFYGHFVYFSSFWYVVSRKIWQPLLAAVAFL
jgi:hypothetical protein